MVDETMVVDPAVLDQLAEDTSPELVPEMLGLFLKELHQRKGRLSQANADQDMDVMGREAHALKSSAATFGAMQLTEHAVALDLACKHSKLDQALEALVQIPSAADQAEAIYREMFPELPATEDL